jgi:peptidoglycan/xylan/chitin deacetylase (PgdA/CDA1 family)
MRFHDRLKIRTRVRSVVRSVWPSTPKPLILMYHRIADEPIDPWGLAVSPAHFEEQLRVLRRLRHPFRLAEFVDRLVAGTLPPHAVALTFDDGYADNLIAAKPRLAAADMPATIFLATGYLNSDESFWWDELACHILSEGGPQRCDLIIGGEAVHVDLGAEDRSRDDRAVSANAAEKRLFVLNKLWQSLRHLGNDERGVAMAALRSVFGKPDYSKSVGRAMTDHEVQMLVSDGLVTIGAHTVTHPVMAGLDAAICRREVNESKLLCESLTEACINAFAYPYGDFDAGAREVVSAAGFTVACSTRPAAVDANCDIFALPRIQIRNVGGDKFEQALSMTIGWS